VSDLERARWFYHTLLGFDVVAYYGRQALFVSAGGYHHHIGLNTWAGAGAPPPPSDTVGLRRFSIVVPTAAEVDRLAARLQAAGTEVENISDITPGISFRDPDEIGIEIRTAL
jgi:catechol 2,3-dioxygenase